MHAFLKKTLNIGPRYFSLAVLLDLLLVCSLESQTLTTLHTFTGVSTNAQGDDTNSDGSWPTGLILSGNTLYGTTTGGGAAGSGVVFALNTNGSNFMVIHNFNYNDGSQPQSPLILSGNTLFGVTEFGGAYSYGTVFAVNTNGSAFTNLHSFTAVPNYPSPSTNNDGGQPTGLVLSGNMLYGVADIGGTNGTGVLFALNTNGTGFNILHTFSQWANDGAYPETGLILSGNTIYGTANQGGTNGYGVVFSVNVNGTGYSILHSFQNPYFDGYSPGPLTLSGQTLYGIAINDYTSGNYYTIFSVSTNGTGFTNLFYFKGSEGTPNDSLTLVGNLVYGETDYSGTNDSGTLFAVNTNGMGFTNLYNFTAASTNLNGDYTNSDGANPGGQLIYSGGTLYGTAGVGGGANGEGTVFEFSSGTFQTANPQLALTLSSNHLILTWPTNATGFTLQTATNLIPPVVWSNYSTAPFIVDGQNTVTNSTSARQMFYRLSR